MSVYAGVEDGAHAMAARAKSGTLKIDGMAYTLTFDPARWVYDVTDSEGAHVVTLNTKKVTVARVWLREFVGTS